MKKTKIILVGILVIALLAAVGCSSSGGTDMSDPESVVKGYMKATASLNPDKVRPYVASGGSAEEDLLEMEDMAASMDDLSVSVSNIKTKLVSQTESIATVEVTFSAKIRALGETMEDTVELTLILAKTDGKWLVKDEIDEEDMSEME